MVDDKASWIVTKVPWIMANVRVRVEGSPAAHGERFLQVRKV